MTKKYPAPRVLKVDDGDPIIRQRIHNYCYSFWFSDNIDDWISSRLKKTRRLVKRLKDEGL